MLQEIIYKMFNLKNDFITLYFKLIYLNIVKFYQAYVLLLILNYVLLIIIKPIYIY